MKKNLLLLMFVLAFLCGGLFVNDVKASDVMRNKSISEKNAEVSRKYAKLKLFCNTNRGRACDAAIYGADLSARYAMALCNVDMSRCQGAQDWAINVLNAAMDVCREENLLEYPVAIHTRKT